MIITLKTKLLASAEQKDSLLRTMGVYNEACNFASRMAWHERIVARNALHRLCYRTMRQMYGLSSQLAIRAIGKVVESYKVDRKTLHHFKKDSAVVYDQRILSFRSSNEMSILTLEGRMRVPFVCRADYCVDPARVRGQADLLYRRGNYFLCLAIEEAEILPLEPQGVLGVDLGIVTLATTSEGRRFSGEAVDSVREKTTTLKRALQQRGTKSAKRHLKKLSGREARFKRVTNHVISKEIVWAAKGTRRAISLEDLKGFSGRKTVHKAVRERFGKWAFGQLRQFIEYKARREGIPVIFVDPRNTSCMCSC